ncbi:MAG: hypothetical protein CMI52_02935 [Parcubacteria group bacterium]|nr:hypothetical protein [Parcubacteria group bacterium]|tara:strand:- start:590 stop:2062 length:1473 start_codon:yes stop_codon:yes gene_type:complete
MASEYDQLISTIKAYHKDADFSLVEKAHKLAVDAHKGQRRMSGEPYVNHPLRTAITLAEMELQLPIVIAGILHDVPEDTDVTLETITKEFGHDVGSIVEGVTKVGKVKYRGVSRYVENMRRFFIAMAADARSLIVKFADRIDNLRTLESLPPKKQYRIALESLEIFSPVASRLGMGEMKGTIEDLAFQYVYPKRYDYVKKIVQQRYEAKNEYINTVMKIAQKELKRSGIQMTSMVGRLKHLYSLHRKLEKYDRDITKIYDLIAIRVIVPDVAQCYSTLGVLHNLWKPLKGRIKDYISQPKPNGYQSLHTTVFAIGGEIVEFQIRTEEMHEAAEYGLAAHWHYSEHEKTSKIPERHKRWIDELARVHKEMVKGLKDIESIKLDFFQSRIFVITPKGDVIDLPEDATPVDFAYAIHTDIGNKCSGARVNSEITRLDTPLKSGDVVEVITDKNRKGPSPDWINFVKTSIAKSRIRTHAKKSISDWIKGVLPKK